MAFASSPDLLLIFHLFHPRRSMRMPLADLPIRCSRTVCRWGRLNRLGIRFPSTFPFLRLFGFLRLFVLLVDRNQPHRCLIKLEAQAEWWTHLLPSPNRPETVKETYVFE